LNKDLLDTIVAEIGALIYEDDRLKATLMALKTEVDELKHRSTNLEVRADENKANID